METDRRHVYDRRATRRLVPPPRMLALYVLVVVMASFIIYRNDKSTQDTLRTQCASRQEAREQSNQRNAVFRKDLLLTKQVWERIAAVQTDAKDKGEAQAIADEYESLAAQVEDYEPIDCTEVDR